MADGKRVKRIVRACVDAFNRGDLNSLLAMEWFEIEGDKIKRRRGAHDAALRARQPDVPPE